MSLYNFQTNIPSPPTSLKYKTLDDCQQIAEQNWVNVTKPNDDVPTEHQRKEFLTGIPEPSFNYQLTFQPPNHIHTQIKVCS